MLEVVQKLPYLNWRIKLGQPLSGAPQKMIWVTAYLPIWASGICSPQRLEIHHSQEFIHWSLISLGVSSLGTPFSTEAYSLLHKTLTPVIKWDNLRDCSPSEEQHCQQFPNQKHYILQVESQALQI